MSAPDITIIIPARDEERSIERCIAAIRAAARRAVLTIEIIVVVNRCTDRTEELAQRAGALTVREDAKNLSIIRNAGAKRATGKYLVTIDADSMMSENMLTEIDRCLRSGRYVGGGVGMLPERWSLGIFLTGLCLLPIALRHMISGGAFFCSRSDFWEIEGFNERLVSAEDIDFARRLKAHGARTNRRFKILWRSWIVTSCRKFDRLGDWYFLLHPLKFLTLLKGRNQAMADEVWYDFPRE